MAYIKKIDIDNIRSLRNIEMSFDNPCGWHIVIGESGTGKTSIASMLACHLLDKDANKNVQWSEWLAYYANHGHVKIVTQWEGYTYDVVKQVTRLGRGVGVERVECEAFACPTVYNLSYYTTFSLSEAIAFCKQLRDMREHFGDNKMGDYMDLLIDFINQSELLPNSLRISRIAFDSIYFEDSFGNEFTVNQLGSGALFLFTTAVDLIRKVCQCFGMKKVFSFLKGGKRVFDVEGVCIIDDIDKYLSPIEQCKVGYWFTNHFPKFQFIVMASTPFVCRASCNGGTIWKLPTLGSSDKFQKLIGNDRGRIIYGDVLDAYLGTDDVFGDTIALGRSKEGQEKHSRLAKLNQKSIYNQEGLTEDEQKEYDELKSYFIIAPFDL